MKIAAFLNNEEYILPFYSSGAVAIYRDNQSEWECVRRIPFDVSIENSLGDIRMKIKMLVSKFDGCNLLILENIKGLPLALLQETGVGVWKSPSRLSGELLDHVKTEVEKTLKARERQVIRPILVGDAENREYEINMIPLLADRSLNSIDILVPFMKDTNFKKLTITCNHLPKWFNTTLEGFHLTSVSEEPEPGVLRVTVNPLNPDESISFRKRIILPGLGGKGCSCN